jgi:hypothetical protein
MQRSPLLSLTIFFSALCASRAMAQGSDDCGAATPITGAGTFAVSTVGSSDSTEQTGFCPTAHHDVWFLWTAAATQSMRLSLCGGTATDTVLAVYPGPLCPTPGSQLGCNDDSCGQQSQLYFSAVSGNTYLVQIGAWNATDTFTGTFSIVPGSNSCGTSAGPDVIVGDITGIMNVTASNGLDAFTLGTTSCNIGDTVVQWSGPTNHHPVISENFYKYKIVDGSGRFEQIGMSWLKHGFAADTGSLCCACQNPGNSQLLGVGCSDPYAASQAGAQSGLTPRYQVNAHTGFFPYPGANPPFSGTTARRCEMALTELEPSSGAVKYYAECVYTTADDALAANNNNNASTKQITVTGGPNDYTFATAGSVQRMWSTIRNWRAVEPGVTLADVQVPGDGLFIVGSHATSLGGGQYHYEFAVHNMNVGRGAGSFVVPIPIGASVTNIGFHDVIYRNGDGVGNVSQSSTDWSGVVSGGSITWSTETPAQNANANAIRWGTTYNFRFDANVAPAEGSVTVGLWNTGSPGQVSAAAEIPSGVPTQSSFCFGDGSGVLCPCFNNGLAGRGCDNSAATGGASLAGTGTPSLSVDTVLFTTGGELPTALTIFAQGQQTITPVNFGDGLRCVGVNLKRLFTKSAVAGIAVAPQPGDPSVSSRSATLGDPIPSGAARYYYAYYRDPSATFCPSPSGDTFNSTSSVGIVWAP